MAVRIVDRNGVLSDHLQDLLDRRLRYALSRFESRIYGTTAVIEDVNGPRGGMDKSCRITVSLKRAREVVVGERDADLAKCITRAAERVGRAVGRALERSQRIEQKGLPRSPRLPSG